MKTFVENIWHDVRQGENIDLYITIGSAFVLTLLNLFGIGSSFVGTITLSALGLFAISMLVNRHKLDQLGAKSAYPALIWETELESRASLEAYLQGATELFVSGGHLHFLLSRQRDLLQKWLAKNKNTKLLFILEDPNTALHGQTPISDGDVDQTRRKYSDTIKGSLDIIWSLDKQFPKRVEVRITNQVPSLTVMIVDKAKARVCLNLFLGGPPNRPVFELLKVQHPTWFELFEDRYRIRLWKSARAVKSKDDLVLNSSGIKENLPS